MGIHVQLGPVAGPLGKIPTVWFSFKTSFESILNIGRLAEIGKASVMTRIWRELP